MSSSVSLSSSLPLLWIHYDLLWFNAILLPICHSFHMICNLLKTQSNIFVSTRRFNSYRSEVTQIVNRQKGLLTFLALDRIWKESKVGETRAHPEQASHVIRNHSGEPLSALNMFSPWLLGHGCSSILDEGDFCFGQTISCRVGHLAHSTGSRSSSRDFDLTTSILNVWSERS